MSLLVDPALFLEWVHWTKPCLTEGEKRVIRQLHIGSQKRVGIDFIERVMFRADATDQLHVFYPLEELTCANGHLWIDTEVFYKGVRYCRVCMRAQDARRGPQLRLF